MIKKRVEEIKKVICKTPDELSTLIKGLGDDWALKHFPSEFPDGTSKVTLVRVTSEEYLFSDEEMLDWMERNDARFGFTVAGLTTVAFKLRSNGQYGALSSGKTARCAMENAMINIVKYAKDFEDEK